MAETKYVSGFCRTCQRYSEQQCALSAREMGRYHDYVAVTACLPCEIDSVHRPTRAEMEPSND